MDSNTMKTMFASSKDVWETPDDLYQELNKEFNFTCDVCATEENKKHVNYFSEAINGLIQEWRGMCWCNPPYSKSRLWIKRAYESASDGCATTVMLIPARTDTKAFHNYIYNKPNVEIRFLKGRLQFVGAKHKAPFPSMVVIFRARIAKEKKPSFMSKIKNMF